MAELPCIRIKRIRHQGADRATFRPKSSFKVDNALIRHSQRMPAKGKPRQWSLSGNPEGNITPAKDYS
jgi:hypothetical protein